ncbi:hypothetical protein Tco_0409143 [Tanacetum coccineum]
MAALKFASSHNMVAFLDKPTESDGFEQIVDFLNAHPIKYALTVNPTIYTSCIEQFWATAKVKTVNGEVQIQALVDKKKVIITETRAAMMKEMFDHVFDDEEVFEEHDVVDEGEPSEFKTTSSPSQASQLPQAKDKGKGKMVEPEKPLKKKDQIAFDEEFALRLHAEEQA